MSIPDWLQHPYLTTTARWVLAFVFLASALGKLRDRRAFAAIVLDYRVLPRPWARAFAVVLPWLEVAAGLMLLAGLGTKIGAALSGVLLLSFTLAVGVNLLRGRKNLDCECAGKHRRQKISGKIVVRNLALSALSFQVVLWGQDNQVLWRWVSRGVVFLATSLLSVSVGLPLALTASGLLMLCLLLRQLTRIAQAESRA